MKDGRPFTFAPALEKSGEIPNLESDCELARLSQPSLMSLPAQFHPSPGEATYSDRKKAKV